MTTIRTMRDLSVFPLEFKEPIPAVLKECLRYRELDRLLCVTTTAALKEWFHFRMHGAAYRSSHSFATKFLRDASARAEYLFRYQPDCYLCVFSAGDEKQPGRIVVHLIKEVIDHLGFDEICRPSIEYFNPIFGNDDGSLPYLIYTESLDQKGLLSQVE